ncbi:MAG: hypothetical protein O7F73_04910 [Gammaproteobacteria bacterium]|nr:hypothetical protein [Gammaproteobacteria bacterium]
MQSNIGAWLPRALVESVLIVVSILLALGLDEWQEDQEIQEMIDRSIINFSHELARNKSRVEDISAYHQGVWKILEKRSNQPNTASIVEFRNIMDAMQPVVLTNSAWQTAVATGVLGRMDFELVSALTLTYNTQLRFDSKYNSTLQSLLSPNNLHQQNLQITIYNASRFVAAVAASESELSVYYSQTLELLSLYVTDPE